MNEATAATWVAIGIAGCALVVSVVTVILQARRDRRVSRLSERLAAIEEARREEEVELARLRTEAHRRADVTARHVGGKHPCFVLRNEGPARASEVELSVKGQNIDFLNPTRIPALEPRQEYRIRHFPKSSFVPPFNIHLSWSDEEGAKVKEMHVS